MKSFLFADPEVAFCSLQQHLFAPNCHLKSVMWEIRGTSNEWPICHYLIIDYSQPVFMILHSRACWLNACFHSRLPARQVSARAFAQSGRPRVNWSTESETGAVLPPPFIPPCIWRIDLADNQVGGGNCTSHPILRWECERAPRRICTSTRQSNQVRVSVKNPFVFRNKTFLPSSHHHPLFSLIMG